ncbi:MAG: hypothetical protein WD075_12175 [Rhodospirillales bacterium]
MFGRTFTVPAAPVLAMAVLMAMLSACSTSDDSSIVAASPRAITLSTNRFIEPMSAAQAHCAKFGRKAVSRGGVRLGVVGYKTMWGYDCVDP